MARRLLMLSALLALVGMAGSLSAQTATGQITGAVKDPTGALVAGAKVTVKSPETGLSREQVAKDGNYTFPLLPVGAYTVTAEFQGFKSGQRSGIKLNVEQVLRVDIGLEVGQVTDVVDVTSSGAAIESENASIGQLINQKQVSDLPLNGRNFLQLMFLGAGAVEINGEQGTFRQGALSAVSIMGARPTSNNYMIDGTANIDTSVGTAAVMLSLDAIQEFKEQTKTYSAEYGFSSNQINLVSKSGTNEFHGSLFGFGRREGLDAKNYFDSPTAKKPPLHQNQFGGVISGPIVKDKTFFLFNYEGLRNTQGTTAFYTVPSPENLAGRFSTTIIDPLTGQPFPNNTIPSSRFSNLANVVLANGWIPAPNSTAAQGNYTAVNSNPLNQNQYTGRIDQDLGKYGRLMARFTKTDYNNTIVPGNQLPGDGRGDIITAQNNKNWQVSHTLAIGSNLVNQFRVGRIEATANQSGFPCPQDQVDALGLNNVFAPLSDLQRTCPYIAIQNYSFIGGAVNAYTPSNQPMWDVSDTMTWVKGKHTLNFGANYRRWWLQRDLTNNYLGAPWGFNNNLFTGNAVADFLLGDFANVALFQPGPGTLAGAVGNPREFNMVYIAPYVQDDIRVSPKLTLNVGLRWDYRNVPYETNNRMGWRNLNYAPGGLLVADPSLVALGVVDGAYYQEAGIRTPDNPDKYKAFAPRLGFAWRPLGDDKTVVRGGWGIFWDSAEGREIDGAADIYPYTSRSNITQTLGQTGPILNSNDMFPPVPSQGFAQPSSNTFLAVSMSPNPKNPYVQQWSLSVDREFARNTTFELSYAGSTGHNLLMRQNIAQATAFTADNPTVLGRRPYPNFGTYIDSTWSGTSKYNSLTGKVEHHGRSLLLTFAYTWSKSTDSKSAAAGIGASAFNGWQGFVDNHNPGLDYGASDFDVRNRIVSSFVWNLPFGKGEKVGGDASGLTNAIIGGWQVNGWYTWQTGFPITITAADTGGLLDSFGQNRANLVPGQSFDGGGTVQQWFNTGAFSQPAAATIGDTKRNEFYGPSLSNLDLSLFKNFDLFKGARLQFRVEAFNVFNHPEFAAGGQGNGGALQTNVNASNFGVITGARPGRIVQLGAKILW